MSPGTPRRIVDAIGYVLRRVLVDPVRDGVLRGTRWPTGLSAIVSAGFLLYALATATVLLAPWLRTWLPLRVGGVNTIPAPVLALVQVVLGFTLTTLFCASLHLRRWLRPLSWLLTSAVLLIPLKLHRVADSPELWGPALWTTLAAPVALGLLMALRWRARFAWWEFAVTLLVIGTALYTGATRYGVLAENPTFNRTLGNMVLMAGLLSLLATPAMLMAGSAFGELAVATAAWSGTALRRLLLERPGRQAGRSEAGIRIGLGLLLVALVVLRCLQLLSDFADGGLGIRVTGLLGGSWVIALIAAAMALAIWWADRVSGDFDLRPDPDDVPETWRTFLPRMALILGVPIVAPQVIGQLGTALGFPAVDRILGSVDLNPLTGVATAVAAILLAMHTARRGLRVAAAATAAFAAMMTASVTNTFLAIPADADAPTVVALPVVLVIAAILLATGRLTTGRLVSLVTVLLLAVAWPYRYWLAEPVSALAIGSGISVTLMLGLVWRLLTDGGFARRGSPGFPVPARVLLVLGNAFIGLLLVLMLAGFGGNFPQRPDSLETLGDQGLGHTVMVLALCLGCAAALPGRGRQISVGDTQLR